MEIRNVGIVGKSTFKPEVTGLPTKYKVKPHILRDTPNSDNLFPLKFPQMHSC
jgi:hypothetical protein